MIGAAALFADWGAALVVVHAVAVLDHAGSVLAVFIECVRIVVAAGKTVRICGVHAVAFVAGIDGAHITVVAGVFARHFSTHPLLTGVVLTGIGTFALAGPRRIDASVADAFFYGALVVVVAFVCGVVFGARIDYFTDTLDIRTNGGADVVFGLRIAVVAGSTYLLFFVEALTASARVDRAVVAIRAVPCVLALGIADAFAV